MTRVTILGATGHTGALAVEALLKRGVEVRACGRDADALKRLEEMGARTKRVDVTDAAALDAALSGADVVANLAGPFLATGSLPIERAIAANVPYCDTTGEQAFMHAARERYHEDARQAGVAVVNALAFEYAYGDLATRAHLQRGGKALHVLYRNRHASGSAGTKKSIVRVLAARTLSYEDWKLRPVGAARFKRTFDTADGPRTGVSFAGGEVLTVPRHTKFRTVRTYVATRPQLAPYVRALAPAARLALRGPVLRAIDRVIDARHTAPENADAHGEVHLVVDGTADERAHVVVRTPDPYVATAAILAEGALRLADRGPGGVLAPAEALDAAATLRAVAERLEGFAVERLGAP